MQEDLLCFTHLRWNFVYQRPQHLLTRFAAHHRVFVIEEWVMDARKPFNEITYNADGNVWVVVPHISPGTVPGDIPAVQKILLDRLMRQEKISRYICWYYSPMALEFSVHLEPKLTIYDCMDELSAFKFAPPALKQNEALLFYKADIVFTGGHHLYESKKKAHHNIHPFPSSIDKQHFAQARVVQADPADQHSIPYPRIGFYGVVDERFDIELLEKTADLKPGWQFVIIGPVVKIDPAGLPKRNNIHYLGGKNYTELPSYLAGWNMAMMPFALNESTRYISPTKTPEYLAGGKPVISTSIRDVVKPYGEHMLVHIADTPEEFIKAGETILNDKGYSEWLAKADAFLAHNSWDNTWKKMYNLVLIEMNARNGIYKKAAGKLKEKHFMPVTARNER